MYIRHPNQNRKSERENFESQRREQKIDTFMKAMPEPKEELLEAPEDMLISEHSEDVLAHWQAPEFEMYERDKKWYLYVTLILLGIVSWAVYSNSPVMAITFILIGVVGYIYIQKEPRVLDFMITNDGIIVGREIYEFDNLESFWIFYEPPHIKILSLKNNSHLLPFVHIPVENEDPVHIRKILLEYIPEEKQEDGMLQGLERLLRI